MTTRKRAGIEELRLAVGNFARCNESFLSTFSAAELVQLHRMWLACDHDIAPDRWTPEQVDAALLNVVPRFDDDGRPIAADREVSSK